MSICLDIEKQLGSFRLDVHLNAGDEVLALLGASGCGKSMTLKCIAGIERPDRGRIVVDGVTLYDSQKGICLSPQKRRAGLLFQNYALFPSMTVRQNVFAGTRRDYDKAEGLRKTDAVLERFGLSDLANRLPAEISGGEAQRTALARILVSRPRILLLDEPFSALDSHLRFQMEQEIREVMQSYGKSVLLVSHNREEAFRLSERIAVMHRGKVEVCGEKQRVFADPGTRNACLLTGCRNLSGIVWKDSCRLYAEEWGIELETDRQEADASWIGIRRLFVSGGEKRNVFTFDVVNVIENPFTYTIMLRVCGNPRAKALEWELEKTNWQQIRAGQIRVYIPPQEILLLKE